MLPHADKDDHQRSPAPTMLHAHEHEALNGVLEALRSPAPFFGIADQLQLAAPFDVVAVCGNWYDGRKEVMLARAAALWPNATLMLTGGRAERLTSPAAVAAGGEPLWLQQKLASHGVPPSRSVIWSGSRITVHNLRAILAYVQQVHAFEQRKVSLLLLEEGFLVRREAAQLHTLLAADAATRAMLTSVRIRPCGARSFQHLVAAHGGHTSVALALLVGELQRLRSYSSPRREGATGDHLVLPQAVRLGAALEAALDRLVAIDRVAALLASGKALLASRDALFRSGAVPVRQRKG